MKPMDDSQKERKKTPAHKKLPLAVPYEVRKRIREQRRLGGGGRSSEFEISMQACPAPAPKNSDE